MNDLDAKALLKGASKLSAGALVDDMHGNTSESARDAIRGFIQSDSSYGAPPPGGPPMSSAGPPPLGGPPPMGGYNYALARANPAAAKPSTAEVPKVHVFNPAAVIKDKESPRDTINSNADPSVNMLSGNIDTSNSSGEATPPSNGSILSPSAHAGVSNISVPENIQRQRARNKARSSNGTQSNPNDMSHTFHYSQESNSGNAWGVDDDLSKPQGAAKTGPNDEDYEADYYYSNNSNTDNASNPRRRNSGNNPSGSGSATRRRSSGSGAGRPGGSGDLTPQQNLVSRSNSSESPNTTTKKHAGAHPLDFGTVYQKVDENSNLGQDGVVGINPMVKGHMPNAPMIPSDNTQDNFVGVNPMARGSGPNVGDKSREGSVGSGATPVTSPNKAAAPPQVKAPAKVQPPAATAAAPGSGRNAAARSKTHGNTKKLSSVRSSQLQQQYSSQRERNVSMFERYLMYLNILLSLGIVVTVIGLVTVVMVVEYDFPLVQVANEVTKTCTEYVTEISQQCTAVHNQVHAVTKQHAPWLIEFINNVVKPKLANTIALVKNSKELKQFLGLLKHYWSVLLSASFVTVATGWNQFSKVLHQVSEEIAVRMS
jgi:hypothetical protein